MVQAIITAAGMGSRMGPDFKHAKTALSVAGEPLIHRSVRLLLEANVDVAVVTGYCHAEVEAVISDLDVILFHNPFYEKSNNIVSLWSARSFVKGTEDLLVLNGDLYYDPELIDLIIQDNHEVAVLADYSRARRGFGDFFLHIEGGLVVGYGKTLNYNERSAESFGISKISAGRTGELMHLLDVAVESNNVNLFWANILYAHMGPVFVIDVSDYYWAEVDTSEEYELLLKYSENKDFDLKYRV